MTNLWDSVPKNSEAKLRALRIGDSPLLNVKNAKSLGALVSAATHPSSFTTKKRVDAAVLTAKRIQTLPIEAFKKAYLISATVAPWLVSEPLR